MAFSPIPGLRLPAVKAPAKVASKTAAPTKTTTPVKTTVTPDPYAAALASQPSLATLLAQASTQANRLAQQQVNAQVAAIQQQQDQAHATAAAQSAEILKAATAAAQFLTPLGDQAAGDYTAAVQNLGGMVGGYTGGLRDTAQAAQDAAQAQLAGISGNTQTVEGQGANLANLLYGVSGSIPANALATQGLGATALARAIPQQELSYGQQQAIGQIGAGNTAADALNTQLASARAQLPTLTSTYLKQFQDSAQNVADQAHQRLMDANTIRNTTSEIAARTATGKRLDKAAAAKAKPHIDVSQSKLTGVLTDQFGHEIYKTVGGKQFRQTLPGFHFDNAGQVVADPKPVTLDQMSARAAEWTRVNHYQSNWQGNPVGGKITPVGGWVVSPDGQSAVPPTKSGKAFIPKVDKLLSASANALVYIGEDGQPHFFKQADGKSNFPYDPNKPAALQVKNSGGYLVVFDPSTGTWTSAHDESGAPLIAGTPKGPATIHYGPTKILENGNLAIFDPTQVRFVDTGQKAYQKPTAASRPTIVGSATTGYYGLYPDGTTKLLVPAGTAAQKPQIVGSDKSGRWIVRINPGGKVTKTLLIPPVKGAAAGGGSPLTPSQLQSHTERLDAALDRMQHGWLGKDPATGGPKQFAPYTRAEAIKTLKGEGYFSSPQMKRLAMNLLNRYFPKPGTVVSRLPSGPAALGLIPRIPGDIIGQPAG